MNNLEILNYDKEFGFNIDNYYNIQSDHLSNLNISNKDADYLYEVYQNTQFSEKINLLKYLFTSTFDKIIVKVFSMIGYTNLGDTDYFLFRISIVKRKAKTAKWFIRNGVDVTCENNLAINYVCQDRFYMDNTKLLKLLLESGADPKVFNDLPIYLVSKNANGKFAEILIKAGADVSTRNNLPICTLLRVEASLNLIKLYVDNGADVTCRNNLPVKIATYWPVNIENLKYLISVGADPLVYKTEVIDAVFVYVLDLKYPSNDSNKLSILDCVLDLGIDINLLDKKIIMQIIKKCDYKLIEYLVKKNYNFGCLYNEKLDNVSVDNTISLLEDVGINVYLICKIFKY